MVLKLLFDHQAESKEERTPMLTELERRRTINRPEKRGNQSNIFKMVDPYSTVAGRKSWINSSKNFDQTLNPTSNYSQERIPRKLSMQSLFSTPGITAQI
jgi:hypothetical protein